MASAVLFPLLVLASGFAILRSLGLAKGALAIGLAPASGLAGLAVHLGERVCASAEPGEVLASRTVVDLVAGSGISFRDRGEHELKGVADRWQLYAVTP